MTEISSQQELTFCGRVLARAQTEPDLVESGLQKLLDLRVTFTEFHLHLLPEREDFSLGQGHHLVANSPGARILREEEWQQEDTGAVGMQGDLGALNIGGFHNVRGARRRAD